MNANTVFDISWAIPSGHEIVVATAWIYADNASDGQMPLSQPNIDSISAPFPNGGILDYGRTNPGKFRLFRASGGDFDNIGFDNRTNRGFIVVEHRPT